MSTRRNKKSVQEVSKQKAAFPKSDVRHWKSRVFKPTFTRNGGTHTAKHFSVKIQFRGRRETFPLHTANETKAGEKARDIYHSLVGQGWDATIEKFKPLMSERTKEATVGQFIEEAQAVADVGKRTLADYVGSFRRIVADIAKIKGDRSKFDYRTGGRDAWLAKIDAVRLSRITPAKIQKWKLKQVKARSGNPEDERAAKVSVNSMIRQAKSLFSERILHFVRQRIELPSPLPFEGVVFFPRQSMRYVSRIDLSALIGKAQEELADPCREDEEPEDAQSRHEQFKIFLLAAFAGLRRNEIDKLLWRQIDFQRNLVAIEATEHFSPKSEDSKGVVELDPEVTEILQGFRARATGPFVIQGDKKPGKKIESRHYRADRHFRALIRWLSIHGVTGNKPLHVLRKEAGSLVCQQSGLYAASRFLRHADVQITAQHYLDKKERVTVGLGGLLSENVVEIPDGTARQPLSSAPKAAS